MKQQWPFMFVIPQNDIKDNDLDRHRREDEPSSLQPSPSLSSQRILAVCQSSSYLWIPWPVSSRARAIFQICNALCIPKLRKRRYTTDTCGFFSQASTLVHSWFEPRNSSQTSTQQEKFSISLTLLLKPGSLKWWRFPLCHHHLFLFICFCSRTMNSVAARSCFFTQALDTSSP